MVCSIEFNLYIILPMYNNKEIYYVGSSIIYEKLTQIHKNIIN